MKFFKVYGSAIIMFCISMFANTITAQQMKTANTSLSKQEKSIIAISSLAAKGDLVKLKAELSTGLDAGLTVNEIKEVLMHLYAYCGFPRSILGLQTFMEALSERKAKGIADTEGKGASPVQQDSSKYQRGKKILSELTKMPQTDKLSGYSAFAPVIDTFLKEHLFADIFERDVLTYVQRELVTISVIATIGNANPMLQAHLRISLNVGITPQQLQEFVTIIKPAAGITEAKAAQTVLNSVLKSRASE